MITVGMAAWVAVSVIAAPIIGRVLRGPRPPYRTERTPGMPDSTIRICEGCCNPVQLGEVFVTRVSAVRDDVTGETTWRGRRWWHDACDDAEVAERAA